MTGRPRASKRALTRPRRDHQQLDGPPNERACTLNFTVRLIGARTRASPRTASSCDRAAARGPPPTDARDQQRALTTLSLWNNNIGDQGARALAAALADNATLTTLNLGSNRIGAAGALALEDALEKNATLRTLGFDSNDVGTQGVMALAAALEQNATLTSLNISANQIGATEDFNNDAAMALLPRTRRSRP
jgi:hypothetical protein